MTTPFILPNGCLKHNKLWKLSTYMYIFLVTPVVKWCNLLTLFRLIITEQFLVQNLGYFSARCWFKKTIIIVQSIDNRTQLFVVIKVTCSLAEPSITKTGQRWTAPMWSKTYHRNMSHYWNATHLDDPRSTFFFCLKKPVGITLAKKSNWFQWESF